MNIKLEQLLEELNQESNEFILIALRDIEDIETLLSECEPDTFEDIANRIWKKEED